MTDGLSPTQALCGSPEYERMPHTLSFSHCQEIHTLTADKLINLTKCIIKCGVTTLLLDCVMETDRYILFEKLFVLPSKHRVVKA